MRSIQLERAYNKANEIDKTLRVDQEPGLTGFQHAVLVQHMYDGILFRRHSFLRRWIDPDKQEWIFIFSEHDDPKVYSNDDDISMVIEYQKVGYGETLED